MRNFTECSVAVLDWLSQLRLCWNDGAQSGFGHLARDRGGLPPGPAGRQRPVIRVTHAGAAGADWFTRPGVPGSQSRDGEREFAPVRDARDGRASGILVTGQQPVLLLSSADNKYQRSEGKAASWATRRTDSGTGWLGMGTSGTGTWGTGTGQPEVPGGLRTTHYKWVALSNTTLGMLIATINASIVIISLPAIFRGIHLDPLTPGNVSYLLWMLMGYLLVTRRARGDARPARRHVRPGADLQPGLRRLRLAAIALAFDPFTGPQRRAVADRLARGPGRRRRHAVRQLHGDPHRRLPAQPARHGARHQPGRRRSPARSSA